MDEVVEIVRQIGRQQGQNAYYRTCYTLLKKTQDLILQTSNELLNLYHSNAFEEPESVSGKGPRSPSSRNKYPVRCEE
jgi:hypothetical protein